MIEERLLTTRQTAAMTSYTVGTLCQWRVNPNRPKNLPFIKQGRSVRYRLSDVLEFMKGDSQHQNAGAAE
jgi:hypothetical protein